MIGRKRGFRIGRKLVKVLRWMTRLRRNRNNPNRRSLSSTASKILRLGRYLSRRAKRLCSFCSEDRGYVLLGQEKPVPGSDIPKGHLAVYVGGRSMEDTYRVVVPVIYFNHPLFGELLREAEEAHGFDHPGVITLPCGISELERVQTRITEASRCRRWRR